LGIEFKRTGLEKMGWKRIEPVLTILMAVSISFSFCGGIAMASNTVASGMDGSSVFHTSPPDGPYPVGVRIDHLDFQGSDMRVVTWYPAREVEGAEPYIASNPALGAKVQGTGVLDAPPDRSSAPYPLIVFSPGFSASADSYLFYTENLASYGYVVVGIDHRDAGRGNEVILSGLEDIARYFCRIMTQVIQGNSSDSVLIGLSGWFRPTDFCLTYRPQQEALLFDQAAAWNRDHSFPLHGMIDARNIGLTGHSYGAWQTLLFGGMTVKPNPNVPTDINTGCLADRDPGNTVSAQAWAPRYSLRDRRVKAIVPLAPPIFNRDIATNAKKISTPMMIITGDSPQWESTFSMQWDVYQAAHRKPKYLVKIKDTDHFVVSDVCMPSYMRYISFLPMNSGHFDEKAQGYKDYSSAFFDLYLKHDKSRADMLKTPNQPFVTQVWHED
jgi:predicted dienelactone hydrolase